MTFPQLDPLTIGDRVPDFQLPDHRGVVSPFYERTRGRPVTLVFLPGFTLPLLPPALTVLSAAQDALASAGRWRGGAVSRRQSTGAGVQDCFRRGGSG